MSGPFDKHYYHRSIEFYLSLFNVIMSELKVDTERGLMQIPMASAIGRRNNLNRQQSTNVVPYATIMCGDTFEVDKAITTNRNNQMVTDNARAKNRIPIILPLEYTVRVKKYGEMMQIVEQMYGAFYPTLDCVVKDNDTLLQDQGIKIRLDSHSVTDNWEGDGVEPLHIDGQFNFSLFGYLYGYDYWVKGRDGDEDNTKIKVVIVDRGLDMDIHWSDLLEWFRVDKDGVHHPEGNPDE